MNRIQAEGRKRIALASYPRSGNTWTRALIEAATGQQTGSIYVHADHIMPRGGEGIVIKTHNLDAYRYTHVVHVVRNPFDAIKSQWHKKTDWQTIEGWTWDNFVKTHAALWADHARYWDFVEIPKFLVRYEDLHADTEKVLSNMLEWMGYEIPAEKVREAVEATRIDNLRKTSGDMGTKFFRQGMVGKGLEAFTEEHRRYVVNTTAEMLERMGYTDLLNTYREPATTA